MILKKVSLLSKVKNLFLIEEVPHLEHTSM
jgi:hypothetical protein